MVLAYGDRGICIRSSTTHLRVLSAYPTATGGFTSKELILVLLQCYVYLEFNTRFKCRVSSRHSPQISIFDKCLHHIRNYQSAISSH